ncbi:unnamed protein product [Brassica rapa]|uniref:Uncharacterized protein n=2 Tax=Brassica campestris TaxID=3711 RepID=A0A8D9LQQ1_BRACM|nr:unnamed protein product [Brassica rapa]
MTSHTVINTSRISGKVPVDGEIVKKIRRSAQRVYGNRWTEIQRKDKVVNNMFTRLCMKRAKHETMASEDKSNKNRMLFLDGSSTPANIKLLLPIEQGASSMKSKEKSLFLGHFHAKGTVQKSSLSSARVQLINNSTKNIALARKMVVLNT